MRSFTISPLDEIGRALTKGGVAFEFGDQVYDQPNRTLGSYAEGALKMGKDHGIKKEIRGYFVDVVNGPYASFGVDTDRSAPSVNGLFEIQNEGTGTEQHRHHTVEVAMFNILSFLWEIETGEPYAMKQVSDSWTRFLNQSAHVHTHARTLPGCPLQ